MVIILRKDMTHGSYMYIWGRCSMSSKGRVISLHFIGSVGLPQ